MPATRYPDVDAAEPWTSTLPTSPPYVDGPLRIVDPVAAPPPPRGAMALPEPPAWAPAPPARRRRGLVAAVVALAVLAFITSFGVVRFTLNDTASTAAAPGPSAPVTIPTAPGATPPTTASPSGGGSNRPTPSIPSAPASPSTPSTGSTPDLSAQAAEVTSGIVNIVSLMPTGVGAGTGVVISADGNVVTNNHVIEGAEQIEVTLAATGETFAATVVGTDPVHDVAVIHLAAAQDLVTVPIGDSDDVQVGDAVAAVGNAGGNGGAPTVAGGHVTALHQQVTAADENGGNARTLTDLIEVDANVQSGDSGGPLISEDAKVIGIDVAASVATSGGPNQAHVGFAIPINRVMSIADDILADPDPPTGASNLPALGSGYLGVAAVDSTTAGASIKSVQPRSPAADAGLAAGDVITAVDDVAISSSADLVEALSAHRGGDQVTITWKSGGAEHDATVTLASR